MTDNLKQRIAGAIKEQLPSFGVGINNPNDIGNAKYAQAIAEEAAQAVLDIVEPMLPKWMPIDDKIVVGKIYLPVRCQNGHEAIATYKFDKDRREFIFQSVPKEEQCNCPKWDIGEGYSANGKPYTILASPAKG